jgi:Domain of unknown function (DUF4399)
MNRNVLIALASCAFVVTAHAQTTTAPAGAQVRIAEPADGATVAPKFKVRFAATGVEVLPAGEMAAGTGHHHLLIDTDSIPAGESVPFTPKHMHFGKGQTEAEVELAPGTYRLTAQFANGAHQSYGAPLSNTIRVTVK